MFEKIKLLAHVIEGKTERIAFFVRLNSYVWIRLVNYSVEFPSRHGTYFDDQVLVTERNEFIKEGCRESRNLCQPVVFTNQDKLCCTERGANVPCALSGKLSAGEDERLS
jgi:hypothetical protein